MSTRSLRVHIRFVGMCAPMPYRDGVPVNFSQLTFCFFCKFTSIYAIHFVASRICVFRFDCTNLLLNTTCFFASIDDLSFCLCFFHAFTSLDSFVVCTITSDVTHALLDSRIHCALSNGRLKLCTSVRVLHRPEWVYCFRLFALLVLSASLHLCCSPSRFHFLHHKFIYYENCIISACLSASARNKRKTKKKMQKKKLYKIIQLIGIIIFKRDLLHFIKMIIAVLGYYTMRR